MFEFDIETLKEQGLQFMDSAKKTALDLADKGKNQLDLLNQQARLSKAQRQLGALVYSLHQSGEENAPLVEKYIEAIAEVEQAIEEIKAKMSPAERAEAEKAAEQAEPSVDGEPVPEEEPEEEDDNPNATKVCPVCGGKVDEDALFCTHCGAQM